MKQLKVKLLNDRAKLPVRSTPQSAGLDLTATSMRQDANGNLMYGLGIAVEIPQGYFGLVTNRSSIKSKDLRPMLGIIDADYRGEVFAVFAQTASPAKIYAVGDRVAQMLILPIEMCEVVQAGELSQTQRGEGGFGSTDKNNL